MTRYRLIIAVVVIGVCTSAVWGLQCIYIPTYSPATKTAFSTQMQTHCLGRYLMDLPLDMGTPYLSSATLYFGLDTNFNDIEVTMPERADIGQANFNSRIAARQKELKNGWNDYMKAKVLLSEKVIDTPNGKAFMWRRLNSASGYVSTIKSEMHLLVGGHYVVLSTKSFPPFGSDEPAEGGFYKIVDAEPAEKQLMLIAQHLVRITDPERAGPGLCLNGVLIEQRKIGYDEEKITFDFHRKDDPEPKLVISMDGRFGYSNKTLHDRTNNFITVLLNLGDGLLMQTIRKTQRKIGGMDFQEWAFASYFKESKTTKFSFLAQNKEPEEKNKRLERPATAITLTAGQDNINSSPYSQLQLEKAWDQWLSTFRLSPGNGGKQK